MKLSELNDLGYRVRVSIRRNTTPHNVLFLYNINNNYVYVSLSHDNENFSEPVRSHYKMLGDNITKMGN